MLQDCEWDDQEPAEAVLQDLTAAGVSRPTALILARRGIAPAAVAAFLRPALRLLTDPFELPGARTAATRLWQAIHDGERIGVHGDYDADGITATVLLASVLRKNGAEVATFLPNRLDDGYGLTTASIDKAVADGCRLLVTVDCGITSYAAADHAGCRNLDLIVTDHHEPGAATPAATAIVNPKLPGSPPATEFLAGVGVAFKVCHAFLKHGREQAYGGIETDLRRHLDLVALGTVADIVPLCQENRALVRYGLGVLSRQQRPGIHALCRAANVDDAVGTKEITFRLAPRLNAAGRMGDPLESLQLLEASNMVDATRLAQRLDAYNRHRQQIEEETVNAAVAEIEAANVLETTRSIVTCGENWHQGVIGIVASRLARRYHRPCVALTRNADGMLTGSARSVRRLNLVSLLSHCSRLLLRFGGHAMAAGLTLEPAKFEEFRAVFDQAVSQMLGVKATGPQLEICGCVGLDEMTDGFFYEMRMLEPFGHGNPEPLFLTHDVRPDTMRPAGSGHTRGRLRDGSKRRIDFIAFGVRPEQLPEPPWDLVYTPQLNRFAGNCTPQLRLVDLRGC